MAITIDGTTGITTPGLVNTGTESVVGLTTTGNTILGDASTDTLNVGNGGLVKDASGNVGIGTSSPSKTLDVNGTIGYTSQNVTTQTNYFNIGAAGSLGNATGSKMTFRRNYDNIELVTIDGSGKVGIGTNAPSAVLYIASDATGTDFRSFSSKAGIALNFTGTGVSYYDSDTTVFRTSAGSGTTTRMIIDSSGNLLVGTTSLPIAGTKVGISGASAAALGLLSYVNTGSPTRKWSEGPDSNGAFVIFNDASAGMYITYGGTSWTASSDERLKTDLIPIENGLEKVNSLRSVTGRFKTDEEGVSRSFLIAQDVQKVLPEAVSVQDDELGTLGVAYTEVIPLLVVSIKELKAIIDTQNDTINNLTTRLETLEGAV